MEGEEGFINPEGVLSEWGHVSKDLASAVTVVEVKVN